MRKKRTNFTGLIFAVLLSILAVLKLDSMDKVDALFYTVAVLSSLFMFIASNRKDKGM